MSVVLSDDGQKLFVKMQFNMDEVAAAALYNAEGFRSLRVVPIENVCTLIDMRDAAFMIQAERNCVLLEQFWMQVAIAALYHLIDDLRTCDEGKGCPNLHARARAAALIVEPQI